MIHVWKVSGEEVAAIAMDDLRDWSGTVYVRRLKEHLQRLSGIPRFRQELVMQNGVRLEDGARLHWPLDLQLVQLPYADPSEVTMRYLTHAAAMGRVEDVESLLQQRVNPDLVPIWTCTPLVQACYYGHTNVVRLLLEARANTQKTAVQNCWLANEQGVVHRLGPQPGMLFGTPMHVALSMCHFEIVDELTDELCLQRSATLGETQVP
ncbi:Asb13 [Symbiodinium pilosum]|uniref:Asb13 protein n=1 Tax=Symbiodinium pilosum TaxID=2952 RepID=A0A812XFD6_SYMPI|nr:Asb13 [Symbiodinium pilosum]